MLRTTLALVLLSALLGACTAPPKAGGGPLRPAPINHIVFFSLQDPTRAAELIADCDAYLATIPGVVAYAAGSHLDTGREAVDSGYDVGLYIGFETVDAYATYMDHPNHLEMVRRWQPALRSLMVRDVLDEGP